MPVRFEPSSQQPDLGIMTLEGDWNWMDYEPAYKAFLDFAESMSTPVYLILDTTTSGRLPANVLSLGSSTTRRLPEDMALIVIAGQSTFVRAVADLFLRVNRWVKVEIKMTATLEEALDITQNHRATHH
ncbi:MAG: hypothetical protein SF029_17065 [bacterium]|nr:hypothetical protein [bacterium]